MTEQNTQHQIEVDVDAIIAAGKAWQEAERLRIAKARPLTSPIAADKRYDFWAGDYDLTKFKWVAFDDELTGLCRRYSASEERERFDNRESLTFEDHNQLHHFGRRSAVIAMRERQPARLVDGFVAVAMIGERGDPRDVFGSLAILCGAAYWIGLDPRQLFLDVPCLAESKLAKSFAKVFERPRTSMSMHPIVETPDGPGLVTGYGKAYHPTLPLENIAFDLAELIQKDKYQKHGITLTAELPKIWLSKIDDENLRFAIQGAVAGALVAGCLCPVFSPDNERDPLKAQHLMLWVVELARETDASNPILLPEIKTVRSNDLGSLGIKVDRLICLVIGKSVIYGQPSYETSESLIRFAAGIAAILKKHCSAHPKA